ncbi:MAG: FliG C-terminal domain-containing protein [Pseudomonadota bacterium]
MSDSQPPAIVAQSTDGGTLPSQWDAARLSVSAASVKVSNIEKAAIILTAIGPEMAGDFLKDLDENALTRTAMAISQLDRVPEETLDAVIAEFLLSIGTDDEIQGGIGTARRLLGQVLDDQTIEKIMFDVEGGDSRAAWKKLNECTNAQLAAFIGAEHPQTAAVILSEIRADKAAGVIERLDPEFAQQAVFRLSRVPSLDTEVAEMVERVIIRDFLSAIQKTKRSRKPSEVIAGLMNNLTSETREKFLAQLEDQKPALAAEVIKTMFTFSDIRNRIEVRDIATLVKELDEPLLLQALKFGRQTNNASTDFILSNMSKRMSERLNEDIDAMPDLSPKEGESAQQDLVREIQALAKAGTISLVEEDTDNE